MKLKSKTYPHINKKNMTTRWLLIVSTFAALSYFVYQLIAPKLFRPAKIALIGGPETSDTCVSNLIQFSASGSCGTDGVKSVNYTCADYSKFAIANVPNSCLNPTDELTKAESKCGVTCTQPTPSPSIPGNGFSCRMRVFKLNPGDNPKFEPLRYATEDREIDPSSHRVLPGEIYTYFLEATSSLTTSVATISASTTNVHGFNEPIQILATSRACSAESKGKYMSCTSPSVNFTGGKPTLLPIGMTVQIQSTIVSLYNTSTLMNPYFISAGGKGQNAQCGVIMLSGAEVPSTPTPTPTPTPSAPPTTKPSPTPTPTPNPTFSPSITSYPVATAIATSLPTATTQVMPVAPTNPKPTTKKPSCYSSCRAGGSSWITCFKQCFAR